MSYRALGFGCGTMFVTLGDSRPRFNCDFILHIFIFLGIRLKVTNYELSGFSVRGGERAIHRASTPAISEKRAAERTSYRDLGK